MTDTCFPSRFPQRHGRRRRLCDACALAAPCEATVQARLRAAARAGAVRAGSTSRCDGRSSRSSRTIPGRFDPQFWLDYFRRIKADAACLSAGGIVAYYPTEVPLHHRSSSLGSSDPFGTLVSGCRALGMHVIARTDPHAAREEVRAAHPDWIAARPDGQPIRHWANPELWVTCALGPYNFEFMDQVHREIVIEVPAWTASSRIDGRRRAECHCVHCQRNFKAATGLELPTSTDASDPARRAFIEWRKARLTELWKVWDATIRRGQSRGAAHPERSAGLEDGRTSLRRSSSPISRRAAA